MFIKKVHSGPVDHVVVFVMSIPNKVEVPSHNNRYNGGLHLVSDFQEELRRARVIHRPIDAHDPAAQPIRTTEDVSTYKVSTPVDGTDLEGTVPKTQKHTP
jgi:hypothetical protein